MRHTWKQGLWRMSVFLVLCATLAFAAQADWNQEDPYKWVQFPDLGPLGIDVNATFPNYILADDFLCTETGRLTQIHIWGSWRHDYLPFGEWPEGVSFTLSIHRDIPAWENPDGYSIPGELLWIYTVQPGDMIARVWSEGMEGWLDPPDMYEFPADEICWQYNFPIDASQAFYQEGTPDMPIVYWLDVQAAPEDPEAFFGWKTSVDHWNDDAVWGMGPEPYFGPWFELRYPPGHEQQGQSIDLSFVIVGEEVQPEMDFGDAPDPPYPTLLTNNGARHVIVAGFFLGAGVDSEPNGQQDPNALGDDNDGNDDEDGVIFTTPLIPGTPATVDVIAPAGGILDAWLDFNGDGSWAGEQIFANQALVLGTNTLSFFVPASAGPNLITYARFRLSSAGGLSYAGSAPDGEVEDYEVFIEDVVQDYKWVQNPDLSFFGIDVNATEPYILADDFECTITGPLTFIHVWGSWLDDFYPGGDPRMVAFTLSLHRDIPAWENPDGYSIPGELLWLRHFAPGEFIVELWAEQIEEGWLDPPDGYWFPADWTCWRYSFDLLSGEPFIQEGTEDNPVIYWLDLQAYPMEPPSLFGWKTSLDHWNDDAVWGMGQEPYFGPWFELRYPPGHEMQGQSIDLAFIIEGEAEPVDLDYGDAPDPTYPTLLMSDGARHVIVPGIYMGNGVDFEPDGQPSGDALGDDNDILYPPPNDDEDGVLFTTLLNPGGTADVDVTVSVDGFLDAWVDFDSDGGWAGFGDQIFAGQPVAAGTTTLTFSLPSNGLAEHYTFARFRFSTFGGLSYTGQAYDGEIEDYEVFIEEDLTDAPSEAVPQHYGLYQNIPNPFNPKTMIRYEVPAGGGQVNLDVFDVEGRRVRVLVDGFESEGSHQVTWNAKNGEGHQLPSGVYFYRFKAAGYERTMKMLLLQ